MFYPASQFAFAAMLEQAWQTVRDECLALPTDEFDPWPERNLYNHGWAVYGLVLERRFMLGNCIFCPATTDLLQAVPGLVNAGFSRLQPGTVIGPHTGYTGAVLRLHLALCAKAGCGLRVGQQQRAWVPGECLVFDDTVEHEAWNRSNAERLVLLLDFAKPQGWSHHGPN